jgi:TetR/AcrR family transcriptional regulator, transcriptional repressor for nem operon
MSSGTQEHLVAAARELMLRQGYGATGISDICSEAGVSKGAFYHSFPSKEAVAVAALTSFHRRGLDELVSIDVSAAPPHERLPLFVERLADRAPFLWQHGCLLGSLATEMALESDTLQRHVAALFDEVAAIFARQARPFVAALPAGDLAASALAEDFLAFVEGAIVLSRAHRDPQRLRASLRRYASSLRLMRRS